MAKQTLDLAVKGLYTSPSTFAGIPAGAATVIDNLVIDQPNKARTRRGQANYATAWDEDVKTITEFNGKLVASDATGVLKWDNAGVWTAYSGTYEAPDPTTDGARLRYVQSNRNLYFVTNQGTYKLDAINATPRRAGAPQGQSGEGSTTGSSGFLPDQTNVAYRIVWGYRDANNNLILGAPSERIIVPNNSGGFRNVSLSFQIPNEITTSWFYQVYRSAPSATLIDPPDDNLRQCQEGVPTAGQITAATVTLTDALPESMLQQFLYTNADEDGILQANYRPPFATDSCLYKNYVFYSNTRQPHGIDFGLTATGAPDGLQVNDTVTFTHPVLGTFTLTAGVAENPATGFFQVFTTGDPAYDVMKTAMSMAKIANVFAANDWLNGYYVSNFEDTPGLLNFSMDDFTQTGFFVNSNRQTCWTSTIPASGATFNSENEVAANRVYWSKEFQPEAVPLGNWLEIGSKAQPIQRIVPLRDGIIVIKPEGLFRISGSTPDWIMTPLDNTVRCLAPNTAQALDNQVFFWSDQGIVAASDGAVQIMSYPIERTLLELSSPSTFPNFADLAFAVPYSGDRKYIVACPTNGTDTTCKQQFCFNTITNSWVRWTREANCGLVSVTDNKLYLGGPVVAGEAWVTQERKAFTDQDYADEDWPINIAIAGTTSITLVSAAKVTVGSTIQQAGISEEVTKVIGNVVYFASAAPWTVGAATVFTPIDTSYRTIQLDAGNAGAQKQYVESSFIFSEVDFTEMFARFTTDLNGTAQVQTLRAPQQGGWGAFPWGQSAWGGGGQSGQTRIRTLVPNLSSRANWLYVELRLRQCFTSFGLSGMSLVVNDQSTRQRQSGDR